MKNVLRHPVVNKIIHKALSLFNITEAEFLKTITDGISQLGRESVGIISSGLGNVVTAALDFVFMILSIFFLLGDGPELLEKVSSYMPLSKKQKDKLIKQMRDIVISTIYGGVTVAIVQGLIGGITFSILGIPSPVVWGLAMFITSFIPLLGTFVIWGPATVYLFFQGATLKGIILIFVGIFVISMVDNILRPLIIRGKMKMPTLAIFFSILGGIKLFGFIGLIMGPLVLALFVSVVEILRYTEEEQKMG
jgi:predicted PurR-regulated permease PerM